MNNNKTVLVKKVTNSILNLIGELEDGQTVLPNDIQLTKQLNTSRSTVRAVVADLCEVGIIKRDGAAKSVLRRPRIDDYYDIEHTKDEKFGKFFLNLIFTGQLLPGDRFSELELARKSGCNTVTVREYLIKFSSNGLIEKIPRSRWNMVKFDELFARELISFRRMVELHSITELLKLPSCDPVWSEIKDLLNKHHEIRLDIENRLSEFPDLDRATHMTLLRGAKNRFTSQFFDTVSFICHYHYQWDKTGQLERFTAAMDEHIELLNNLLANNAAGVIAGMQAHLNSAESTLLSCVEGLDN